MTSTTSAPWHVALLRGINVGRAKRVAMADLRGVVEGLGYLEVRTLLNSGNVAFRVPRSRRGDAARNIERELARRLGLESRVFGLSGAELATLVSENPLAAPGRDPSRLFAAVFSESADRKLLRELEATAWSPEALAVGSLAAYLWCPRGMMESPLADAVTRALRDRTTVRNWSTIGKLHALVNPSR